MGATPAAWILPSSNDASSTGTTGSPAKSQLQNSQTSVLGTKFLPGEPQTDTSPRSLLLSPLQDLDFKPWLGRSWKRSACTRAAEGQDHFSQMLSAPALNWTLEAKTGQKRGREVWKCAQQRPWFDAGNHSAVLG